MTDMSETEIKHILSLYKSQRLKDKMRYEKVKDNEDFKVKNRLRAKAHYEKTKEVRRDRYSDNRDLQIAKNSYYYYKRTNNIETFQEKYPERYKLIKGFQSLNEQNPSLSTTTCNSSSSPSESLSESDPHAVGEGGV